MDRRLYQLKKRIGINLIPFTVAIKTSFAERYAKPLQAPTLICQPSCAILACGKVGT
jgi:hypothetical protein